MTEQELIGRLTADLESLYENRDLLFDPVRETLAEIEWAALGKGLADMGYTVKVHPNGITVDGHPGNVPARQAIIVEGDRFLIGTLPAHSLS